MLNAQMRLYNYSTLQENDDYGQPQAVEAADKIKMAINFVSEAMQEAPLYSGAQYVGLTLNKDINASYIIHYGSEKLKVTYVNALSKYTQVFMARM